MTGSEKENELRIAYMGHDLQHLFSILDDITDADRSDSLEEFLKDKILATDDVGIRNALAIALADIRSTKGADVIRSLLREKSTRGNRGTLLYALSRMEEGIDLSTFIDTILYDSLEAAEGCIDALEEHRVNLPNASSASGAVDRLRSEATKSQEVDRKEILNEAAERIADISF